MKRAVAWAIVSLVALALMSVPWLTGDPWWTGPAVAAFIVGVMALFFGLMWALDEVTGMSR